MEQQYIKFLGKKKKKEKEKAPKWAKNRSKSQSAHKLSLRKSFKPATLPSRVRQIGSYTKSNSQQKSTSIILD